MNVYPRGDIRHVGTIDEQIEDTRKVTIADVRAFYAQFYGATDGKLVVNGQCDAAAVQKLAGDLFGAWKSPSAYTRVIAGYQKTEPVNRKIETPADKQNAIFFAAMQAKMSDTDPDYPAMQLANLHVRRIDRRRVSVSSASATKRDSATASTPALPRSTKPRAPRSRSKPSAIHRTAPKVEASMLDELAHCTLKDGFTAEEVAASRKSWLEEQAVNRSQDQGLLAGLMGHERFGITYQYDADLEAKVAALTPQQVNDAFRRHVTVEGLAIVKAGDFKKAGVFQ